MATSKLLKPTNVTISIPAGTDIPDQSVASNCIDKEGDAINALSDQIANFNTPVDLIANASAPITTDYAYIGQSFTLTKRAIVKLYMGYNNGQPYAIGCKNGTSNGNTSDIYCSQEIDKAHTGGINAYGILNAGTYYVWGKASVNGNNNITVTVYYMP